MIDKSLPNAGSDPAYRLPVGRAACGSCTTVIVGRKASADGSRIFGRTEDSEGLDVKRIVSVPAKTRSGPWTYTDDTNGFSIELPAKSCQYLSVPNALALREGLYDECVINEFGVSMTATESIYGSAAALAADPLVQNGVAESAMPTVIIPYVRTAREGVLRLGGIVETVGSAESNAVVLADRDETWYMEIYTGHQWAAVRCPEDCYAVIANDGLLGYVDAADTHNVLASAALWTLPKAHGFLAEYAGKPHLALTYCAPHRDYSQMRVWAAHRRFSPSQTGAYDVQQTHSLFMKPDKKIALDDVMELTRYRYEDTAYNVNERPRLRAIGINRTAEAHLFWLRDGKPPIVWIALANPEMSVYLPVYQNAASFPAAFGLDCADYDPDSAYYKFRRLSALAVQDRARYGAPVRAHWKALETKWIAQIDAMDARYASGGQTSEAAAAIFSDIAEVALRDADRLFDETQTRLMEDSVLDGGADATGNAP